MEVIPRELYGVVNTAVTVMRRGSEGGFDPEELQDGNTIPRLCKAIGEGACLRTCQRHDVPMHERGVECAERNIRNALQEFGVEPENFVLVSATEDNIVFADDASLQGRAEGYDMQEKANAFFFRPGVDKTHQRAPIHAMGMRMADCGSLTISMTDSHGDLVLGQAHFSRTNMRGPSAYIHERNGDKVSWAEKVIGDAIDHYDADPRSVRLYLSAAVEGDDFIHHYADQDAMEKHYPGWNSLGFMHPLDGKAEDFDCRIDYREMIAWQVAQAQQKLRLSPDRIDMDEAINTGNLMLGHASHHAATKGAIEHGRDLYITGINPERANELMNRYWENAENYAASGDSEDAERSHQYASEVYRLLTGKRLH